MQLSIFNLSPAAIFFSLGFRASVHKPPTATSLRSLFVGGLKWRKSTICLCDQGRKHFSPAVCTAGGLKWTRTIDLTLIRRVL